MSLEIVQFIDGKYGIRKRTILDKILGRDGRYKDFNPIVYHWRKPCERYFNDCQMNDLEIVKIEFAKLTGQFVSKVIK